MDSKNASRDNALDSKNATLPAKKNVFNLIRCNYECVRDARYSGGEFKVVIETNPLREGCFQGAKRRFMATFKK